MRFGILLTSNESNVEIRNIKMPELEQKYYVLKADDIPGENRIDIFGTKIPILAEEAIHYKGEAILAIFGPDYESTEILKRQIEIETGEISEPEKKVEQQETVNPEAAAETSRDEPPIDIEIEDVKDLPFSAEDEEKITRDEYGWGNIEDFRQGKREAKDEEGNITEIFKEYRKVESEFNLSSVDSELYTLYSTTCWTEGNSLHVDVPTQYPELVRRSVAEATGIDLKKVILHIQDYNSPADEFFYRPTKIACIAAVACLKLKLPVEIRSRAYSRRGAIKTIRTTYLSDDNHPLAEEVVHTVELGAYPILWREYQRQAIAGLIPSYPLSAFKATVQVEKSDRFPSSLFASLGYSEALASTEYHISEIAKAVDMTPLQFRMTACKDKRKFTDYLPAIELTDIKKITKSVASKSSFDRKWSANNFQKFDFGLLGYIRGIGLASGIGIAGFSTSFIKEHDFQAKLTYTAKDTVTVNSSAFSHGTALKYWQNIIQEELNLDRSDDVIFISSEQSPIDSGPKVLSRFVCNFSRQLLAGAKRLKQLKETEKPPFSLLVDVENKYFPCEFDEGCFGSMVVEIRINENDYRVVVEEVWAEYSIGVIAEETILMNTIKQTIMRTLAENGAILSEHCRINVSINRRLTDNVAAVVSMTRALATGALMNALTQAFGKKGALLPTSAEYLLSTRKAKKEERKANA